MNTKQKLGNCNNFLFIKKKIIFYVLANYVPRIEEEEEKEESKSKQIN